ncbi:hypothetical protein ABZS29_21035 [Kribbella sp. NPDC005582]|uniref:hypothetical protein n=1 Tax=Kribbella sp. NPDC005582 TaxID=3156893 RepID=UPI0033B602D6
MNRRILALLTTAAIVAGSTTTAAAPAQAATSKDFVPQTIFAPHIAEKNEPAVPQNVVPVGSVDLEMAAGQTAWVLSVMHANDATQRSLFDNEIVCKLPDGTSKNAVIGQNVYERTHPAKEWTDVNLATRYLVQSPTAGKVTCTANVRSHSLMVGVDATYRLVGGRIWIADQNVGNATDGKPLQQSPEVGSLAKVDSTSIARVPALDTFDLPAGYKTLSVFGETQYQICFSVPPCRNDQYGSSTAQFTLIINQWKLDGGLCQTSQTTSRTETYPYYVHHAYVPLNKGDFAISTAPGCIPRFNAYVRVDWKGGDTGGVQGGARGLNDTFEGTTTHRADMSHVFVIPLH